MGAIFLGTPSAAVPSLCALAQVASIDLVITQPDRPAGRSKHLRASPVKVAATELGFDVAQPASASELHEVVHTVAPDVALVVAYGRILKRDLLDVVPFGFLNVHFSLLPRWRGAAPVERSIAAGDLRTGVTLMKIDDGLDTGPVIAERATEIAPDDTGGILTARLAHMGATLVDNTMPEYLIGRRVPVPQIATGSTHAQKLTRAEAEITADMPVEEALRHIRAFTPRPGPWCLTASGEVKIHGFGHEATTGFEPGTIALIDGRVVLGVADGGIELKRVQPQGKPAMDAHTWMNGRRGEPATLEA